MDLTRRQNVGEATEDPIVEQQEAGRLKDLKAERDKTRDTTQMALSASSWYASPKEGEKEEDAWDATNPDVCGTYGCMRRVNFSHVGKCEMCHSNEPRQTKNATGVIQTSREA